MRTIVENTYGNVKVIKRNDCKWGVVDSEGKELIPFGKYDWIDGFDDGLARVRNGNKWGIINEQGAEVIPLEYDSIWNFLGKHRSSTNAVKDGRSTCIALSELKSKDKAVDDFYDNYYQCDDYYGGYYEEEHYGEYAGSYAQDVMGYSDEYISDVFDGCPDAYWNID